jgi:hypothetical protein
LGEIPRGWGLAREEAGQAQQAVRSIALPKRDNRCAIPRRNGCGDGEWEGDLPERGQEGMLVVDRLGRRVAVDAQDICPVRRLDDPVVVVDPVFGGTQGDRLGQRPVVQGRHEGRLGLHHR